MDYFPSPMMDNHMLSIQDMISLDCDIKTDEAMDAFLQSNYTDKYHQSDLDKIFLTDEDLVGFNTNSMDSFPLDTMNMNEMDTMKWLNDDAVDLGVLSQHQLEIENTNPNLMVNPQVVMPHDVFAQTENQASDIATLTPSTPIKVKVEVQHLSSPHILNGQIGTLQFVKLNNATVTPHRANNTTPLRCQQVNRLNSGSPINNSIGAKPPSPAVRALYREIHNPSRSNPILLEQLQNPVQTAIKAAQNIAALNNQFSLCSNAIKHSWHSPSKNGINHRNVNQERVYQKPVFSYSCLIAMALKNSRSGSLPVSEIYNFMITHFPYFKTAPGGWKNSVRHNLSLNKCFEKVENPNIASNAKKGCLWGLNPAKIAKMAEEIAKWRKKDPESVHNSMSDPDKIDLIEQGKAGSPPPLSDTPTSTAKSNIAMAAQSPMSHAPGSPSLNTMPGTPPSQYRMTSMHVCKDEMIDAPVYGVVDCNGFESNINIDPVMSELSAQWDEDLTSDLALASPLPSSPLCHSPILSHRTFNGFTSSSYLNVHASPQNFFNIDQTPTKQQLIYPRTPSRTISAS